MSKNTSTSNSSKFPKAFVSSLIIFFILQAIVVRSDAYWDFCYKYSTLPYGGPIRSESNLRRAKTEEKHKKIFLLGSSQTQEGFDIKYLDDAFKPHGYRFVNLAVASSAQPIDMYLIKDKVIEKKPDVVIYMPFIESFYAKYDPNDMSKMRFDFHPRLLPYMNRHLGVHEISKHKRAFVEAMLGRVSIFYKYRAHNRELFERAFLSMTGFKKVEKAPEYQFNQDRSDEFLKGKVQRDKGMYYYNDYTDLNEEVFNVFAQDVVSHGIKLIVLSGPTHPYMHEIYAPSIDARYHSFLRKQAKEIGYTYIEADEMPNFTKEYFADMLHFNHRGRTKFSHFMRDYLYNEVVKSKNKSSIFLSFNKDKDK